MAKKPKPEAEAPQKPSLKERMEERAKRLPPKEGREERQARIEATLNRMHAEANPPGRSSPSFVVRFPEDGMRERLAHMAKKNNRSANAEIIDRLQRSMIGDTVENLVELVNMLLVEVEELQAKVRDHDEQLNVRSDDND